MPALSRRRFLKGAGAALASLGVASGTASATHFEQQPEHVDIDYPEALLQRHRPRLVTYHLDFEPSALYGWRAQSAEHDTDVLVFWAGYPRQEGVSPIPGVFSDSHWGDHEPIYVFLDSDTGEPVEYRASVYHWMAGSFYPESTTYDGTNPIFKPVNPWHQYTPGTKDGLTGDPISLYNLGHPLKVWLDESDFHESLEPGLTVNPWRMRTREHWWRSESVAFGLFEYSFNAILVSTLASISRNVPFVDYGGLSKSATEHFDF